MNFEELEKDALAFIAVTPEAQSLLYDLDLLPEQLQRETRKWGQMLSVAQHLQEYGGTSPRLGLLITEKLQREGR